jgi:uncharacterized protein DUF1905
MRLDFGGEIIHWRGPAPYHFVLIPEPQASALRECGNDLSYGWGCIAARGWIGDTEFTTALFPKDGTYAVPIKIAVRRAEGLELGDAVQVRLDIDDAKAAAFD